MDFAKKKSAAGVKLRSAFLIVDRLFFVGDLINGAALVVAYVK